MVHYLEHWAGLNAKRTRNTQNPIAQCSSEGSFMANDDIKHKICFLYVWCEVDVLENKCWADIVAVYPFIENPTASFNAGHWSIQLSSSWQVISVLRSIFYSALKIFFFVRKAMDCFQIHVKGILSYFLVIYWGKLLVDEWGPHNLWTPK